MLRLFVAVPAASALRAENESKLNIILAKQKAIENNILAKDKAIEKLENSLKEYFDAEEWTIDLARQDVVELCADLKETYVATEQELTEITNSCSDVKGKSKPELKTIKESLEIEFYHQVVKIHKLKKHRQFGTFTRQPWKSLAARSILVVMTIQYFDIAPQSMKNSSWLGGYGDIQHNLQIYVEAILNEKDILPEDTQAKNDVIAAVKNFMEQLRKKLLVPLLQWDQLLQEISQKK